MEGIGKVMLIIGGAFILLGSIFLFYQHIPFLGKLPGDIIIKRDSGTFYFPLVTFLIISGLLTVLVNIVLFFLRK